VAQNWWQRFGVLCWGRLWGEPRWLGAWETCPHDEKAATSDCSWGDPASSFHSSSQFKFCWKLTFFNCREREEAAAFHTGRHQAAAEPPSIGTHQGAAESGDGDRQGKIARMREEQRRRRQQMAGQIDMNQQSDIMKSFEQNILWRSRSKVQLDSLGWFLVRSQYKPSLLRSCCRRFRNARAWVFVFAYVTNGSRAG